MCELKVRGSPLPQRRRDTEICTSNHYNHPSTSPCLRSLYSPRFAEGISDSDKSVYVMLGTPKGRRDAEVAEVAET